MISAKDVLLDGFDRVAEAVRSVLEDIDDSFLTQRIGESNSIAWLIWHLTRIQDDHVSAAFDCDQLWMSKGFFEQFGFPFDHMETGYAMSPDDVAKIAGISGEDLLEYFEAVHQRTIEMVELLPAKQLDQIVDRNWDPPVTLAVRLMSVIADDLQHAGQAALLCGAFSKEQC